MMNAAECTLYQQAGKQSNPGSRAEVRKNLTRHGAIFPGLLWMAAEAFGRVGQAGMRGGEDEP